MSQIKQVLDREKKHFSLRIIFLAASQLLLPKAFELSIICTTLNTHFGSTYVKMRKFIADVHVYKMYFKGISKAKCRYVKQILLITLLRKSLCKNQTTWEMNIFNPPSNFACSWALCTLVAMVTTTACSRPGASFSYKNVAKKE